MAAASQTSKAILVHSQHDYNITDLGKLEIYAEILIIRLIMEPAQKNLLWLCSKSDKVLTLKAVFLNNSRNYVFFEDRNKTVKNRPICLKLEVSKLQQFSVLKSPICFNLSNYFSSKNPREI